MPLIVKLANPNYKKSETGEGVGDGHHDQQQEQPLQHQLQQQQATPQIASEAQQPIASTSQVSVEASLINSDGFRRSSASLSSPSPLPATLQPSAEPQVAVRPVNASSSHPSAAYTADQRQQNDREQDALDALQALSIANDPDKEPGAEAAISEPLGEESQGAKRSESTQKPASPPQLDIIVAPAVLAHRYVRGRDVSLIVERPERVRATLLGVSAVMGRLSAEEGREGAASRSKPDQKSQDAADDLVAQLAAMDVGNPEQTSAGEKDQRRATLVAILHSWRSASLATNAAVAAIHATEEDVVDAVLPAFEEKRRARSALKHLHQDSKPPAPSTEPFANYLHRLCSMAPHHPPAPPPPPAGRYVRGLGSEGGKPMLGRTRSSYRLGNASAGATPASSPMASRGAAKAARTTSTPSAAAGSTSAAVPPVPEIKKEEGQGTEAGPGSPHTPVKASTDVPAIVHQDDADSSSSSSSDDDEAPGSTFASEVPLQFSQGDLYIRGSSEGQGTREAIEHALGATLEAVDRVVAATQGAAPHTSESLQSLFTPSSSSPSLPSPSASHAFVLTRPPGHHCASSAPSGFCWVNNVAVAAKHAQQAHGIDRVVIFDIDLHHGNGTQKIVWRLNEDAQRLERERQAQIAQIRRQPKHSPAKSRGKHAAAAADTSFGSEDQSAVPPRPLRLFYGSLHDIESFPCEDGDADLVRDASTVIEGAHGQWISNVHLQRYGSPEDFRKLYEQVYIPGLLGRAERFLRETEALPERTLVFISCGFDACSYEMPGMQRHHKHVPPGFYGRFAADVSDFARQHAQDKVVSLLEGGYGDRALCSGMIAHVRGLARIDWPAPVHSPAALDPFSSSWFSLESLKALEKMMSKRLAARTVAAAAAQAAASNGLGGTSTPSRQRKGTSGGGASAAAAAAAEPAWLKEADTVFTAFEELCEPLMRKMGDKTSKR
ncbi:unnamed protein product [Jaminaea pallidilutea]